MTRRARLTIAAAFAIVAAIGAFAGWRVSLARSASSLPAVLTPEAVMPSPLQPARVEPPSQAAPAARPTVEAPIQAPLADAPRPPTPAEREPAPRALPFEVGEELRYQVLWSGGGGVSLPAGDAVFRVETRAVRPGAARPGYRFELTITTASWVSAFFEARDRFWSLTGPDLEPMTHVQELNEGRRHATRTMTFDAPRGRVLVASGAPESASTAAEFPWVAGVRDPLGAFYEARLIGVTPASRLSLPVNNVGHALTLLLGGVELTSVAAEGRAQQALLLDARIDEAGSQEPNPSARVWFSTDARRIPLAIDVSGAFGTLRVELTSYRRGAPSPGA